MMDPFLNCPECGSKRQIAIVYGYPSQALVKEARIGNVKLGGCVIRNTSKAFICDNCGIEYGPLHEVWALEALRKRVKEEEISEEQLENYLFELILLPDVSLDQRIVALRFIKNYHQLLQLRLVADNRLQTRIKKYLQKFEQSAHTK